MKVFSVAPQAVILSLGAALQVNYLVQIRRRIRALDLDSHCVARSIMNETLLPRKGTIQPSTRNMKMEEVPMKLNDSISTYDVAEALQGETGKFEVTSPNGERYFVTCQPGHSIVSLEWAGSEPNLQPFLVRKVAQPIATEGRSKRSAAA
jgi:hypothetical protein